MNVPLLSGAARLDVPAPLVTLTVDDAVVTLEPVRPWLRLVPVLRFAAADVVTAFPLRGRWFHAGVGLELRDGRTVCIWTSQARDQVLRTLAEAEVHVEDEARSAWRVALPWLSGAVRKG